MRNDKKWTIPTYHTFVEDANNLPGPKHLHSLEKTQEDEIINFENRFFFSCQKFLGNLNVTSKFFFSILNW